MRDLFIASMAVNCGLLIYLLAEIWARRTYQKRVYLASGWLRERASYFLNEPNAANGLNRIQLLKVALGAVNFADSIDPKGSNLELRCEIDVTLDGLIKQRQDSWNSRQS